MPPVAGEQDANITVETATGYVNVAFVSLGIVRFPHCYARPTVGICNQHKVVYAL